MKVKNEIPELVALNSRSCVESSCSGFSVDHGKFKIGRIFLERSEVYSILNFLNSSLVKQTFLSKYCGLISLTKSSTEVFFVSNGGWDTLKIDVAKNYFADFK